MPNDDSDEDGWEENCTVRNPKGKLKFLYGPWDPKARKRYINSGDLDVKLEDNKFANCQDPLPSLARVLGSTARRLPKPSWLSPNAMLGRISATRSSSLPSTESPSWAPAKTPSVIILTAFKW